MPANERFWSKVRVADNGCLEWTGAVSSSGYGNFNLNGKTWKAHRYAFFETFGSIPEKAFICHHCDNPLCVNPGHLFAGSRQDNVDDMMSKGRAKKASGMCHHTTHEDIQNIAKQVRDIYKRGEIRQIDLADRFGISQGTVSQIIRGVHWTQDGASSL